MFRALQRTTFRALSQRSNGFSTLVLADHNNAKLGSSTLNAVQAASKVGNDITVLVAGKNCAAVGKEASAIAGVKNVLVAEHDCLANWTGENMAALLVDVCKTKG